MAIVSKFRVSKKAIRILCCIIHWHLCIGLPAMLLASKLASLLASFTNWSQKRQYSWFHWDKPTVIYSDQMTLSNLFVKGGFNIYIRHRLPCFSNPTSQWEAPPSHFRVHRAECHVKQRRQPQTQRMYLKSVNAYCTRHKTCSCLQKVFFLLLLLLLVILFNYPSPWTGTSA